VQEINAEVVVVFQGSTELGNTFMMRTSYLPQVGWGKVCACMCATQSCTPPRSAPAVTKLHPTPFTH